MKEKIIKYYEDLGNNYAGYHNHKEISAWGGLVLFVLFAGFISKINLVKGFEIESVVLFTFIILFITWVVYRYISTQLEMKDIGGAYVAASMILINELIKGDFNNNELNNYLIVEEASDTKAQSRHVLPQKLLKKAEVLNTRGRSFQDTTRTMIYCILFLISFLMIVSVWGKFFLA